MFKGKVALISSFAGAMALVTAWVPSTLAQTTGKIPDPSIRVETRPEIIVTKTHIALLKNVLNLRPEQEPYWVPLEAALNDLARSQAMKASEIEIVGSTSNRQASGAGAKKRLKRLTTVAAPLIRALDENQRRDVMMLARTFGFERLVASF
jgi:hypothetical protein